MTQERPVQTVEEIRKLISNLQVPDIFAHSAAEFDVVETHISILLLTGSYVYKFKKPVNPGFLDFSTLDRRKYFCERELTLNQRLAPSFYLDVIAVRGTVEQPQLHDTGPPIEYSVKMKQFSPEQRFDRLLERDALSSDAIDAVADRVARFHEEAERIKAHAKSGSPENLADTIRDVTSELESMISGSSVLEDAREWLNEQWDQYHRLLDRRRKDGMVRDVHGDLHLENIAWFKNEPVIFDCIEFNDSLRQIDVMNEVAFLVMDLERLGRSDLAWRCINRYLEHTGDYAGVQLLAFFNVYRALVRAMVTAMKHEGIGDEAGVYSGDMELASYFDQVERTMKGRSPGVFLLHGFSGSGKTTVSQELLERLEAIRLRSDVERKRLFGLSPDENSSEAYENGVNEGIYSEDATEQTYRRLKLMTGQLLNAEYPVLVDASFLRKSFRDAFYRLAEEHDVPFAIIDVQAGEDELRKRISERKEAEETVVSEADLEVLESQLASHDPLTEEEKNYTVKVSTDEEVHYSRLEKKLRNYLIEYESMNS